MICGGSLLRATLLFNPRLQVVVQPLYPLSYPLPLQVLTKQRFSCTLAPHGRPLHTCTLFSENAAVHAVLYCATLCMLSHLPPCQVLTKRRFSCTLTPHGQSL